MLNTVKTLCMLSGVSGCEQEIRDYLLERVLPFADEIETDAMGNLLVMKKGKVSPAQKLMLCAHMDEVGVIITGYDADGFLRFDFIGGIDRRVILGKRVFVGENKIPGVIGLKPIHLVRGDEKNSVPKVDSLYIDIGAENEDEAKKAVALGDRGVFEDRVVEFGDGSSLWRKTCPATRGLPSPCRRRLAAAAHMALRSALRPISRLYWRERRLRIFRVWRRASRSAVSAQAPSSHLWTRPRSMILTFERR